ncbi:MAG: Trehalose/maltose import ATP-binding protein MalK [Methanomassiliicoccales archaeon PtaU1.Bin124]|nr:MAG: Trehalose/maltose import ATP-binding protein MalK [Methanomassiliicoccales archaeon PtaU1.Bin124]
MSDAIEVKSVTRVFGGNGKGPAKALDDVSLSVKEGELFGLLGPNGAGKTTLIKILATLLLPSSGQVKVLGYDVEKEVDKIRPRINMVSGGDVGGYGLLTVRENLWMFSQFYGIPTKEANERIDHLLKLFALDDKSNAKVRTISTGQKQKMNVIRGFVTEPDVIYLDEPTLGLDVNASFAIRTYLRKWVKEQKGKTMLLTTHYMVEADELCDRVAIIDKGKILACDTPINLKRMLRRSSTFDVETTIFPEIESMGRLAGVEGFQVKQLGDKVVTRYVVEQESVIADVISAIQSKGGKLTSLSKTEPTLEDVFIHLVGRGLE